MANFFRPAKSNPISQKHFSLYVERLDHLGAGIGYQKGKPIFVEGALAGETVIVQLTEQKSKYAKARLIKVEEPSANRVKPFCPHYLECGGCHLQHLSHEEQVAYKSEVLQGLLKKFAQKETILEKPILSQTTAYRRRARLSVKFSAKKQQLEIGFRQKSSHQIININTCPILEKPLQAVLIPLRECLVALSQPERIGHIELIFDGTKVGLLVRHQNSLKTQDLAQLEQFAQDYKLSLFLQTDDLTITHKIGATLCYDEIGVSIDFMPTNFIQVNATVNQHMVSQAIDWLELDAKDKLLDLFCGLGNFSLPISQKVAQVVGVEGVMAMVDAATSNAQQNKLNNVKYYQADLSGNLSKMPWANQDFNKVILDPARAGASAVLDYLSTLKPSHILYISCNPATFSRDCGQLIEQGYQLTRFGMLDMFPHTRHIESMALFTKAKAKINK